MRNQSNHNATSYCNGMILRPEFHFECNLLAWGERSGVSVFHPFRLGIFLATTPISPNRSSQTANEVLHHRSSFDSPCGSNASEIGNYFQESLISLLYLRPRCMPTKRILVGLQSARHLADVTRTIPAESTSTLCNRRCLKISLAICHNSSTAQASYRSQCDH
jgi:hypothetical protein